MAHESFANTVMEKTLSLAAQSGIGEVTADAVSKDLDLRTRKEHKRMLNNLSELAKNGRIRRVSQGVYGPPLEPPKPDKRQVMWSLLRMRRRVSVDDLVEMAAVASSYAKEWLRMLEKQGVVRKREELGFDAIWFLLSDTVQMPEDTAKADRLRRMRRERKQGLIQAIGDIGKSLDTVKNILQEELEEGQC